MNTDYQSPALRITARRPNHARAGMFHAATAVLHAAGTFALVQVEALKRDPELIVDEVGADGLIHFDAVKLEAQLRTHLEQDRAGVAAVIQRLFPGLAGRPVETFVSQIGAGGTPGSAAVSTEALPLDAGTAVLGPHGDLPAGVLAAPATPFGAAIDDLSGVEQQSARLAHAQEVGGATPPPAPNTSAGAAPPAPAAPPPSVVTDPPPPPPPPVAPDAVDPGVGRNGRGSKSGPGAAS